MKPLFQRPGPNIRPHVVYVDNLQNAREGQENKKADNANVHDEHWGQLSPRRLKIEQQSSYLLHGLGKAGHVYHAQGCVQLDRANTPAKQARIVGMRVPEIGLRPPTDEESEEPFLRRSGGARSDKVHRWSAKRHQPALPARPAAAYLWLVAADPTLQTPASQQPFAQRHLGGKGRPHRRNCRATGPTTRRPWCSSRR